MSITKKVNSNKKIQFKIVIAIPGLNSQCQYLGFRNLYR